MKRILFLLILLISISCSENESVDNTNNYYALKVGNSWVYKNYEYNRVSQTYNLTDVIDSVSIVGTEMVNDKLYYKFRRFTHGNDTNITFCNQNGQYFELLRDSLGYLVNTENEIKFVNNNFEERLISEGSWGGLYEQLQESQDDVTVNAGVFTCEQSNRYARNPQGDLFPSNDKHYYSDGVGLIKLSMSYISSDTPNIIRKLDSYNIQ